MTLTCKLVEMPFKNAYSTSNLMQKKCMVSSKNSKLLKNQDLISIINGGLKNYILCM